MKNYLVILLMIISIQSRAQNIKALDAKFGFREMQFDDSVAKFDDLVAIEYSNDSSTIFYKRTGDKLTIGSTEVTIYYGFYNNIFYAVNIKTKGYENSRSILKTLEEMYGKGYQSNRYIQDFGWYGKKVSLRYDENSITNDATVYMCSKESLEKQRKDAKVKANKAKDDF